MKPLLLPKKIVSYTDEIPFFVGVPALIWQLLFFILPLMGMLVYSFASLYNFVPFLTSMYGHVLLRSLALALTNVILCFCIAYPLAYCLVFHVQRFKNIFLFFLIIPFWTNFLLHIFAWFFVLEKEGVLNTLLLYLKIINEPLHLVNSITAILIMMVYYYLPFMILPIYSSLERFDIRLMESSADLGATWWQTIRRVVLPLSLPGIQAGVFLVFVPSFGEFAIPELMGGDKIMFAGSVISRFILSAQTAKLGVAFTIISSITLIMAAAILYWLIRKIMSK